MAGRSRPAPLLALGGARCPRAARSYPRPMPHRRIIALANPLAASNRRRQPGNATLTGGAPVLPTPCLALGAAARLPAEAARRRVLAAGQR